jgi:DNA-binding CsgD family transcriptional regulator
MRVDIIEKARLGEREIDILWLLSRGNSKQDIAEELKISGKTINSHLSRIRTRLAVATKQQEWTLEQLAEFARKEL